MIQIFNQHSKGSKGRNLQRVIRVQCESFSQREYGGTRKNLVIWSYRISTLSGNTYAYLLFSSSLSSLQSNSVREFLQSASSGKCTQVSRNYFSRAS